MGRMINMVVYGMGAATELSYISVASQPTKLLYASGDYFDPDGMVVTATYSDGTTKEIRNYLCLPEGPLTIDDTEVTILHTEAGISASATVAITMEKQQGVLTPDQHSVSIGDDTPTVSVSLGDKYDGTLSVVSDNVNVATASISGGNVVITGVNNTSGTANITVSCTEGEKYLKPEDVVIAVTARFAIVLDPVFANNEWSAIVVACEENRVPDTWNIGDSKMMTVNGTDYQVDIIGKNHDTYFETEETAPLTFQFHDCIDRQALDSSSTAIWHTCTFFNAGKNEILSVMPEEIATSIKEVQKKTCYYITSSNKGINISRNTLFLLSESELTGSNTLSGTGEGDQYEYYAAGNSIIKTSANPDVPDSWILGWGLRSPLDPNGASGAVYKFLYVSSSGEIDSNNPSDAYFGIAPAFCF